MSTNCLRGGRRRVSSLRSVCLCAWKKRGRHDGPSATVGDRTVVLVLDAVSTVGLHRFLFLLESKQVVNGRTLTAKKVAGVGGMSKRNLGRKRKREERTGWCRRASLSTSLSLWGGLGIAEFSKMCVFLQARQSQSLTNVICTFPPRAPRSRRRRDDKAQSVEADRRLI